jgi:hypothetical protein
VKHRRARASSRRIVPAPRRRLLSRRDVIKLGAAATGAAVAVSSGACAKPAPLVPVNAGGLLTANEFAILDELSEIIIPTDEHSPGARAAKVAAYIDARLGEAFEESEKTTWREGLRLVEQLSTQLHSKPFMQASPSQRLAVVTRIAQHEAKPQTPEEIFFGELKARVAHAYYSSEIGLKQELEYKGNVFLQEFVGTDVSHG